MRLNSRTEFAGNQLVLFFFHHAQIMSLCSCTKSNFSKSSQRSLYSDLVSFASFSKSSKAAKTHRFKAFAFSNFNFLGMLTPCSLCESKVFLKEYRCSLCGLHGHRKCLKSTLVECPECPILQNEINEPIFGQNLADVREMVPLLLVKCVQELEDRGFDNLQFLYESDGSLADVARVVRAFDFAAEFVDLSEVTYYTIGSVLKRYLYEVSSCNLITEQNCSIVAATERLLSTRPPTHSYKCP